VYFNLDTLFPMSLTQLWSFSTLVEVGDPFLEPDVKF
jgi:hypothetical protein